MATVGRLHDRLPVLAHGHDWGKAMNPAARARRRQETTNKADYVRQGHVKTDLQDTSPQADTAQDHTKPTPLSRLSDPLLAREGASARPSDTQLPSIEKSPWKRLTTAQGERDEKTLPGVNQADPGRIYNPMPGKNQPNLSIDAAVAATLLVPDDQTSTMCKTITTHLTLTKTRADPTLTTWESEMNAGFAWPTPTSSVVSSAVSSAPTLLPVPSFSTFILFSRSEKIEEQVTKTTSSRSINTPLAVSVSSTPTALTASTIQPTASNIASSAIGGSSTGLTPLSRSLFVLFGVLGAITMLIAVAVFYMARRTKKRQEQADRYIEDVPVGGSKGVYDYGSKTRMSADTVYGIPPFLTDSERNIVRRAATQDGQPEVHITAPGARLHDAINSFIAKSRRLTYKISP